jgi:hypothetical protein
MASETTNRSTPILEASFHCYRCGHKFDNKYRHRRKIQTGSNFDRKFPANFRMVDYCPECNEIQIKRDRIDNTIMSIVILTISVVAVATVLSLLLN